MELQIGTNPSIICDHVKVWFIDSNVQAQDKEFLYLNPSYIKSVSVYLEKEDK